jgi:hypothetical protein
MPMMDDGWMVEGGRGKVEDGRWKTEGGRRKVEEGRMEECRNASNVVQVQHDRKSLDAASILKGGLDPDQIITSLPTY